MNSRICLGAANIPNDSTSIQFEVAVRASQLFQRKYNFKIVRYNFAMVSTLIEDLISVTMVTLTELVKKPIAASL